MRNTSNWSKIILDIYMWHLSNENRELGNRLTPRNSFVSLYYVWPNKQIKSKPPICRKMKLEFDLSHYKLDQRITLVKRSLFFSYKKHYCVLSSIPLISLPFWHSFYSWLPVMAFREGFLAARYPDSSHLIWALKLSCTFFPGLLPRPIRVPKIKMVQ